MTNMDSHKAKALLEEVEHLLPNKELGYRQVQENLVRLGGITNTNYKLFNLFIRIPRPNLNPFFNRRAESYNLSLLSREDLTEEPLYFNLESGLLVNAYTSPEIYFDRKILDNDIIDTTLRTINNINRIEIPGAESFDMQGALLEFRKKMITKDTDIDWLISFHKAFFIDVDRNRLEFSHNDPDFTNFTVTKRTIDLEYSGMAPVLSDLCNLYSQNIANINVESYLMSLDTPFDDMQPLTIFWLYFWGLWGLYKEPQDIPNKDYLDKAKFRVQAASELLYQYRKNLK